jgi:hypothetical protein
MARPLTATLIVALAAFAGFAGLSRHALLAAPTPSVVPVSWELNIKHFAPERLVVEGKTYWFMRYTVINNTGRDILFTPEFELLTDTGQVVPSFKDVPKDVFKKIKALYNNSLLQSQNEILGKILQGEDNAKDGVILFADVDPQSRVFQVFISGLSGETAEVKNPVTSKTVVLQKTLVLEYTVPGEAINIEPHPIFKGSKWVMK